MLHSRTKVSSAFVNSETQLIANHNRQKLYKAILHNTCLHASCHMIVDMRVEFVYLPYIETKLLTVLQSQDSPLYWFYSIGGGAALSRLVSQPNLLRSRLGLAPREYCQTT